MIAQKNVTHLAIGKDLDILANGAAISSLADGQIAAREVGASTAFTGSASGKRFQLLYKKAGGAIIESPVIDFSKIVNKNYVDYVAPAQRVRYIGFNGTSGSIDAQNNEDYIASVSLKYNTSMLGRTSDYVFTEYTSGASATQAAITAGVTDNWIANFSDEAEIAVSFERLINNAGTAITGTGDLTVVNGSKVVGAATDADAVLSVGDALRFGTAVTDSTYIITAIDSTNDLIYLDIPYQGVDATVLEANAEYVAAAAVATDDWGIKLSANALATEPGLFFFDQVDFDIQLRDGFGDTTVTNSVTPTRGSGSYDEVSYLEYFLSGNRGDANRVASYPINQNYQAVVGETYDIMSVNFYDSTIEHIGTLTRPQTLMVVIPEGGSNNIEASLKTMFGL